jgi:hypothetical protein
MVGWEGTGQVCTDIDECLSNPCQNGAACTQSFERPFISIDQFSCACVAGFTNGECTTSSFGSSYVPHECTTLETSSPTSSQLHLSDSSWIQQFCDTYTAQCSMLEGTFCDADVDECMSRPCQNGALCADSTVDVDVSIHAYRCTCLAGYTNGNCGYSFALLSEYAVQCTIMESDDSASYQGNCDMDVDECMSGACLNGATCHDSTTDSAINADEYRCTCAAGWEGSNCAEDINECTSNPCVNGATCTESATTNTEQVTGSPSYDTFLRRDEDTCEITQCHEYHVMHLSAHVRFSASIQSCFLLMTCVV